MKGSRWGQFAVVAGASLVSGYLGGLGGYNTKHAEHQDELKVLKANTDAAIAESKKQLEAIKPELEKVNKLKTVLEAAAPGLVDNVASVTDFHEAMLKFGLPSEENLHFYSSFRIPNWVMQHITKDDMADENIRKFTTSHHFTGEVPHIPPEFRASNKDYFGSGWSRGHMVPAGDNRKSQGAMDATFHLNSNIVPQNLHNNMHFWYRLEVFAKDTMTKQFKDVYVITGPAFLPTNEPDQGEPTDKRRKKKFVKYEVLGDNNVAVPTHLFKVIVVPEKNPSGTQTHLMAAFLVPNEKIPDDKLLSDYEVPIDYLEKHTGLKFYPKLDKAKDVKPLCEATACKVMTELQLKHWNYARKLDWAKTRQEVEDTWSEFTSQFPADDRTKNAYERKLASFK